jgi:drug/metabolite transporter (DMT)-like permease
LRNRPALLANLGAAVGSCLVGAAVVATREAVDEIDPFGLAFLRYLQGAVVLIVILAFQGNARPRITRADFRSFAVLGLLMFAAFPVLFNTALTYTTASRGAVIIATMPLWTALLARRYSGEQLGIEQTLGVLISITGIAVVFAESALRDIGGTKVIVGNALMVIVAMIGAVYGVRLKPVLARHEALVVTAWAMGIGAAALAIPALIEGLPGDLRAASLKTLLLVLYLGIAGGAIAFWLFSVALARLSPTQTVIYINLNPLVATLLAAIFLDEPLTISFAIGFALVVVGLVLTNVPRNKSGIRSSKQMVDFPESAD